MVGASDEALAFIQEFTARRFPPRAETPPPPRPPPAPKANNTQQIVSPSVSSIPNAQSEGLFPSLPKNQQPYETMWPANINVHQKKDDEYFAG